MIPNLKPYRVLTKTGQSWLEEVPTNWDLSQLRALGTFSKGRGGSKEDEVEDGIPCVRYGDIYAKYGLFIRKGRSFISSERASAYTRMAYGDVLFAGSGETIEEIGKSAVNLLPSEGVCGGDVILFRPGPATVPEFLGYALESQASVLQKSRMGLGVTVMHIYPSQLRNLWLAVPPLSEQAAIVRFLDHVDRRIQRYIRAKQKLIKLLEEQRQTVIHHAVTRGLDPNVGLKPSGVDWLGDIPEHWEVRSFSRCAVERADYRGATPTKTESGIFLVTAKNVRRGWIDYDVSREFVAENQYLQIMRRGLPRLGDLLLTMEAPLGNAALVDAEDIALAQRVVRFRFDPDELEAQFVLQSVLSLYFQNQLLSRGTGSTAMGIKASKLPQLKLLKPPISEQKEIVDWIERVCSPLQASVNSASRGISLLREYRTRLIADAVTGKIDLREIACKLSEEPREADWFLDYEALEEELEHAEHLIDELEEVEA